MTGCCKIDENAAMLRQLAQDSTAATKTDAMTSGWRYSVQVPDFTKEERHGEEIVVVPPLQRCLGRDAAYYQVDVLVQAPGATEPAPPTTVWRRYSEFRQLHSNLKAAYPEIFKRKEMEPPSKRSLRFVNNNDRLLHERRQQLETWLWNLLSSNEIAHSRYMKIFLQLNLAVRGATASSSVPMSLKDAQEDEQLETSSEISAPSGITNMSHALTDIHTPGTAKYSTKTESVDTYRMGLRVEQRRELKQLMKIISSSLEKVSQEARDVRGENQSLQRQNRLLEEQLSGLSQVIKDGQYSQDEQNEELRKAVEEREGSLKKSAETVRRLEASLKEAHRKQEALETEMQSVRQEGTAALEKRIAEVAVLESKLESHAVHQARMEQELEQTKHKSKQDNRLLAEAVVSLRQENAAQIEKLTEKEAKIAEMQQTRDQESTEVAQQRTQHQDEIASLKQQLHRQQQEWESRWMEQEKRTEEAHISLDEKHRERTSALRDRIMELEQLLETASAAQTALQESSDQGAAEGQIQEIRLVIDVSTPAESTASPDVRALDADLLRAREENAELREAMRAIVEENASLKESHVPANGIAQPQSEVANLDGLMRTIQELQEQNRALQEATHAPGVDLAALERFSQWLGEVHRELHSCSVAVGNVDGPCSSEEANGIIEKVANSNGTLQLLTAQVEEIKNQLPENQPLLEPLFEAATHLLSDGIQKCKDINEMKIDAFLSRTAETPSMTQAPQPAQSSAPKHLSPRGVDSNTISEDGGAAGAPSVKMFLGGLGAKMSQGSQGLRSFMQRGTPPSVSTDTDSVSLSRRSEPS